MNKNLLKPMNPKQFPQESRNMTKVTHPETRRYEMSKYSSGSGTSLTPKNYHSRFKVNTLHRYSSEADFRWNGNSSLKLQTLAEAEDEQDCGSPDGRSNHQIQHTKQYIKKQVARTGSIPKFVRYEHRTIPTREKYIGFFTQEVKSKNRKVCEIPSENQASLKETSSTEAADKFMKNEGKYPSFFKTKSKCNQVTEFGNFSKADFQIIRRLGAGKFGVVQLVRQKKTGIILAMKVFEKKKIIQQNYIKQFTRQLKIQAYLDHPFIIKMYGLFHDQMNFYTIIELACDGELYGRISNGRTLEEETISYIIKSLLITADYMHSMKIFHRDIKPENIVLTHGTVKLCDFGWAVHQKEEELRATYCGTPLYFSPELLKGSNYDEKVDIWAIGVMAYELQFGSSPFNIKSHLDLYKIVTQPVKFPTKDVSQEFKQFAVSILQKNPKDRLSCKELLELPFITKYENLDACDELCSGPIRK